MSSAPTVMDAGATPKSSADRSTSTRIRPWVFSAAGGGASTSFQSGSSGTSWACTQQAHRANSIPASSLEHMLAVLLLVQRRLRVGLERGAGRQFQPAGRLLHAVMALMVARPHAAAQVAVAVVVPGQEARELGQRHL